jgi:hypothetical protein
MKHVRITDHECRKEPVDAMCHIVVIKVVDDVFFRQLAVVVVRVHVLRHRFVQIRVQEAKCFTTEVRPLVQHEDHEAHVDKREHNVHPLNALKEARKAIIGIAFQVCEGHEEGHNTVRCTPCISPSYICVFHWISGCRLKIVVLEC